MSKTILAIVVFFAVSISKIASQNQKIYVTRVQKEDNSVEFNYIKSIPGNYFLEFDLESVTNVQDISAFKKTYNLNITANSGTLFKLYPIDKDRQIYCSYAYSYKKGLIKPEVDNSVVYYLPFKENKNVEVYESFRYNVSPEIWKNYGIYSKTKDTICAMRRGVVTDIRKFPVTDKGQTTFRTEVIVDHADGTNASYIGVDEKSIAVKVNDLVFPGSRIGLIDDVVDEDKNHNFKFNVYYFSDEEIQGLDGKSQKIVERSVFPVFYTMEGYLNLANDKKYTVKHNEEIFFKEMTAQEKEKYKSQYKG
ncbi:hypothetical protein [Flavobacterium tistrianum]|uniref:hypothetical protein n=1 Tax=Flavobacterium tistrianum TaxID=1685414 RepID=UPI0013A6553E|nr:hypothetical protein [Flavobacterium tistrianum]KAF2340325.1 hypothetical protein DMB71_14425 [Flavobacterium tistrianum]